MLWHKAWIDTRWRFLIGLAILMVLSVGIVVNYSATRQLLPILNTRDVVPGDGEIARMLREAVELQRTYRGFVWFQGFRQNLAQFGTLLMVLLGCGGLLLEASKGSAMFTLSLPVSRTTLFTIRAATGIAQCFALAMIPALMIPVLSRTIGEHYSAVDALVHGLCVFVVGTAFFSLASLLSTVFNDVWRPLLISCGIGMVVGVAEIVSGTSGVFSVMSGEQYMRTGQLPWIGLLASAAVASALLFLAARNNERLEF